MHINYESIIDVSMATEQVTVLHRHILGYTTSASPSSGAILSDSEAQIEAPIEAQPETKPEVRPEVALPVCSGHAAGADDDDDDADDDNDSDKEIMVQFPPWPQVIDLSLIN